MNSKLYLISKIPVKAYLISDLESVKEKMDMYPGNVCIAHGSRLKYSLPSSTENCKYYVLFEKNKIIVEIHSSMTPRYFTKEGILKFISIVAVLDTEYEIEVKDIFPYLIDILYGEDLERRFKSFDSETMEKSSDIILAKRISNLLYQNDKLNRDILGIMNKLNRTVANFIVLKYTTGSSVKDICTDLGISEPEVNNALDFLPNLGYKKIAVNGEKFRLVRLR